MENNEIKTCIKYKKYIERKRGKKKTEKYGKRPTNKIR